MSTSQDQTSNCHFRKPRTPHKTEPEWMPMRMSMSCFVRERTYLNIQIEKVRMDRFCYIGSSVMVTLNNGWVRELAGTRTLCFIGFIVYFKIHIILLLLNGVTGRSKWLFIKSRIEVTLPLLCVCWVVAWVLWYLTVSAAHKYTPAEQGPLICYLASIKGQKDRPSGLFLSVIHSLAFPCYRHTIDFQCFEINLIIRNTD